MGGDGNPDWFEHTEMMLVSSSSDDPVIDSHFTVHPNRGLIHGFTLVLHDGAQYNLRGCRELTDDRTITSIGPMAQNVILPLESWEISVEPNSWSPMSMVAQCIAEFPAQKWPRFEYPNISGAGFHTFQSNVIQLGSVQKGSLALPGKTWNLRGWSCFRDHCWGYRQYDAAGGPTVHTWLPAFFPSRRLLLLHAEGETGNPMYSFGQLFSPSRTPEPISQISFGLDVKPSTKRPVRAGWNFLDAAGQSHKLRTSGIDLHTGLLFSGGWTGENPDDYNGPLRVEGDRWTATQRQQVADSGGRKSMVRYHINYQLDDEPGFGLLTCFMGKTYRPGPFEM